MKLHNIRNLGNLLFLLMFAETSFAANTVQSLGEIAEHLIVGTSVLTTVMHIVCFVVGFSLLISAISFYKAHRDNPKFVPLDRPIICLCLAIVIFALPFYGILFGPTGSTVDYEKREAAARGVQINDIDAPLNWGTDYDH